MRGNDEHVRLDSRQLRAASRGSVDPARCRRVLRRPRGRRSRARGVRPLDDRARGGHRARRHRGRGDAGGARGLHVAQPGARAGPGLRDAAAGLQPAAARHRPRPLRGRCGGRGRGGDPRRGRRRGGVRGGRLRPAAGRGRCRGRARRRRAVALRGARLESRHRVRVRGGPGPAGRRRARGVAADREPARGRGADGAQRHRGHPRRRRTHLLRADPGRARRAAGDRRGRRPRRRARAGHRARRRRWVRREDRHVRRVRGRGEGRAAPRPAGEVDRDPLREHGGDDPGPRPGPARRDGVPARRHHHRGQGQGHPGRRRLPVDRCVPALPHADDGAGRLRDPEGGAQRLERSHEHDRHRRVPRRGPARGDPDARAHHRHRRRRARDRPRRDPQAELHPAGGVPARDPHGRALRRRRVRQGARRGVPNRGLRRAACRAGGAARARRHGAAGHRGLGLRRGHRRRTLRGVRRDRDQRRRLCDRDRRHLGPRAGSRDRVLDDRAGAARHSRWSR